MQNDFKLKTHEGVVTFTPQKLESFRDAYAAAEEGSVFDWDGRKYKKY